VRLHGNCFQSQNFRYHQDGPDKNPKGLLEPLSNPEVKFGLTPLQSHRSYFSLEISLSVETLIILKLVVLSLLSTFLESVHIKKVKALEGCKVWN
jgi:hypothetical protein